MDRFAATLELLRPEEIPDALYLVDLMERAGHMDADEAGEWRRRIQAWCRFGPRAVPAKASWRVPTTLLEEPDPFVL
jgi:hypothetical protein